MKPRKILTTRGMDRALARIAREIVADGIDGVALVGIRSRGVPLAEWLARKITERTKQPVDVGSLDINLYRDDLSEVGEKPLVRPTEIPFAIAGRGIILVDDVLYTGRTIRAAMDALIDYGRPRFIRLVAMIDRGWREFPIQADYVGKKIRTAANENVKVQLRILDGVDQVVVKRQAT